jgi:uncharacterized protein
MKYDKLSCGDHLVVIIKTVERCNINCSYCYVFNMSDNSYKSRPIYISDNVISGIIHFLKNGCIDLSLKTIDIIFHGGEPLMQKKNKFDSMCATILSNLSCFVKINFGLQTNAMLVDDEWINLFHKYNIGVGVSLDGPKDVHDLYRRGHNNMGTYDKVVKKIKLMQENSKMNDIGGVGILCVVNPDFKAKEIYRHFVDELNIKSIDFLLPDFSYNNQPKQPIAAYGEFLCDIFDEWAYCNHATKVSIRFLESTINALTNGFSRIYGEGPLVEKQLPLITISNIGELGPLDQLRNTNSTMFCRDTTVFNRELIHFVNSSIFKILSEAQTVLPSECRSCCWQNACKGGALTNRYSEINQFDNPSIYCQGLKNYYSHVVAYLLKSGKNLEILMNGLGFNRSNIYDREC